MRYRYTFPGLGVTLTGIWLILTGLSAFVGLGGLSPLLAVIAIIAGICLILGQ